MQAQIDKSFDLKQLNKYSLGLKIGGDFFSANVLKVKSNTHLAVTEQKFSTSRSDEFPTSNFVDALKSCPVKVSKKYGEVSIAIANKLFSVVPKALFSEKNLEYYISLNTQPEGEFDIKYQVIDDAGVVICFILSKKLNDWINKVFPNAKITHEISVLIQSVLRDFHSLSEDRLLLNISNNYLDVIQLKKGKLNFVNSFLYNSKEDLLYYTLYACEQLGIDPHEIETFMLGEIQKGSEEHLLLFQYIKNIHFGSRNKNIKLASGLNGLPNHYFYSLFNQHLCV
ncbi:MAG: hypothetical protein CMP61_05400 [Flavobacteriales bacterium]|mgnify:CR=1 FL=1|nr:hypothetical protein [Flavobacteriales bacterium]|tara:strand:+ start:40699 stop:41547 length:849 start_codon:yes stop_codon:yes gene_type:complete